MAAKLAAADAAAPGSATATTFGLLLESLGDVVAQFNKGVQAPTVCFSDITRFAGEPLAGWKGAVERALGVGIELRVSIETNAVTLIPQRTHMSSNVATLPKPVTPDNEVSGHEEGATPASEDTTTSAGSTKQSGSKGRAKNKAPRPKNAFIIYRKEWHPIMVARCPDLHNNDISVLIGSQWKDESDDVKNKYRAMAAEEKRQHLIDHPGYQYQPRKPSEKKKRMTKNKLAKLRAQDAGSAQNPMQEVNDLLAAAVADNQATINTFPVPYRQGFPTITDERGVNGFLTNGEHEDFLFNQLTAWNADHQGSAQVPAVMGQTYVDGQSLSNLTRYNVPMSCDVSDSYKAPAQASASAADAAVAPGNNMSSAHNGEVDRQASLFDDSLITDLFDLDAFDVEFN